MEEMVKSYYDCSQESAELDLYCLDLDTWTWTCV